MSKMISFNNNDNGDICEKIREPLQSKYYSNIELRILQKEEFLDYFDHKSSENIILIVFNSRNCIEKVKKEREVQALKLAKVLYESAGKLSKVEPTKIILMKQEDLDDVMKTWSSITKKRFSYFFEDNRTLKICIKNRLYNEFFDLNSDKMVRLFEMVESSKTSEKEEDLINKYTMKLERIFFPIEFIKDDQDFINKLAGNMCKFKSPI